MCQRQWEAGDRRAGGRRWSPLGLGIFLNIPDHQVHAGSGIAEAVSIHIVLNDLSEVVSHEVPKGALVGEAQEVWEEHRCVHRSAMDELQGQQVAALQDVSNEDSISIEHTQQDGLDILEALERDAYVDKVSLSHFRKPCVVAHNLIVQLDEGVLTNLHVSVYHGNACQLQPYVV
uniref:Uncharacterized protein n=1 Tax=Myotis myotis TaxID=51298 RepID=A0A7J8AMU1_MYOMY|nr:hypothetical protein mMyoMyo1_007918 [Myotis myotis]